MFTVSVLLRASIFYGYIAEIKNGENKKGRDK
jgi:hypothetical protein